MVFRPGGPSRLETTLSEMGGGRQSSGGCKHTEVYTYVGGMESDVMGHKEWEQESLGARGSVGLESQSRVSQRLLLFLSPREATMILSGVELHRAHHFNMYQMFQHTY